MSSTTFTPSTAATSSVESAAPGHDRLLKGLTVLAAIGFIGALYMALVFAGTDSVQGNVQRIFYLHLGAFMGGSIGYIVALVGGVAYLRTRNPRWDTLALAGVEVGLSLTLITLITGSIWARPMWNTWWTWDPRLTSAAVMALTYAAYLMLRNALENPEQRRKFAAVYAIFAISTVVFTFIITRIRPDTIHPTVIGPSSANAQGTFEMTANMGAALGVNMMVWCALIAPTLIWWRVRLENVVNQARQLRVELDESK
jgi:heme exporter protein C